MVDNGYQVRGEKMYDKARRGESVELSPRRISIYQFDIERSLEDRYSYVPLFLPLNSYWIIHIWVLFL
jgi:tRNA U55 pseudouridine synthase TruB